MLGLIQLFKVNSDKFLSFYIHHRNLYNKGSNEVGFVKALIPLQGLMVGWLFLKSIFPVIPPWVAFVIIPLCVVLRVVLNWVVGYWWEKNRVFDKENDWNNERNPVLNGLGEKVLNIKGSTREIGKKRS